jgi:hypothetical protein
MSLVSARTFKSQQITLAQFPISLPLSFAGLQADASQQFNSYRVLVPLDFAELVNAAASNISEEYRITNEQALEELPRFIAIKITVDEDATRISPTPLFMYHFPIFKMPFSLSLRHSLPQSDLNRSG